MIMAEMTEIRWHGRGGQGAKTASLLLADAAFMAGKYVQSFPEYGPERSGAPITAYNRISDERCTIHSNIYDPDYAVVVDETLLTSVDVTAGLKKDGAVIVNSEKHPEELRPLLNGYEGRVYTVDAGTIPERTWAVISRIRPCWPQWLPSAACWMRNVSWRIWRNPTGINLQTSPRWWKAT